MHRNRDICVWAEGPEACELDPKGCYPCRLRHWSTNGAPGVRFEGGKDGWHDGPTRSETYKEMVDGAKRAGNEPPEPVGGYASGGPLIAAT